MATTNTVAIAGTDEWLRVHLGHHLSATVEVRDVGAGTSYLNGVNVLVLVPQLAPRSGSGSRDVGIQPALHTLNVAHAFSVTRAVLVSRVGQSSGGDTYLGVLDELERAASASFKRLTVTRLTHPFGPPDDPGPLLDALGRIGDDTNVANARVQPIYVGDAVDVIAAAAEGRCGTGVIEVGGPETMALEELAAAASTANGAGSRKHRLGRSRRGENRAIEGFLALDSVTSREYAAAGLMGERRVGEVWSNR